MQDCEIRRKILSLAGLHAKVYVLDNYAALVTSANATQSGMTRNWECGVAIEDSVEVEEIAKLLLGGFGARQAPQSWSASEIELLREPVRVLRGQLPQQNIRQKVEASELPPIRMKRQAEKALLNGFIGWTNLVLEVILTELNAVFHLDELFYACKPLAAERFAKNRFVRPQLRKQLQRLRDLGLIEFLGGGNYRRSINS